MARWTFEQQAAIDLRGVNLLISAAAGSGKTAVLVERITKLVLSREAEIHKLLVVTYTNAAASEMRGRIELALSKAIDENEGDSVYLNEQIKLLNRANIKTFHAFCLDVIRSHFQKIDCDPSFKLMGEPERVIMVREAIMEVLEMYFEKNEDSFLNFVESYSGNRSDEKLIELIMQLYRFIQSQPHPQKWLDFNGAAYSDENHDLRSKWVERLKSHFISKLENAIDLLYKAIELSSEAGGPAPYIPTFESDIKGLENILALSDDFNAFGNAVLNFKFDRIASIKKGEKDLYDPDCVSEVKDNIRDKIVKKQVFESIKKFFEYKPIQRFNEEISTLGDSILQICELTMAFSKKYQEMKKQKNLMDFNDLEHYAIEILEDPDISALLREKFEYIFVDEYQDSSGIQEHIINAVCKENNVFMVGDVKQSIYKFRLADPELFITKYKRFTKLDALLTDRERALIQSQTSESYSEILANVNRRMVQKDIRIDLKRNFRTRGEILESVNRIFSAIMSEKLGEINYDDDAKLYPGMVFEKLEKSTFEINILSKKTMLSDEEEEDEREYDAAFEELKTEELEALAIAGAIKSRIGSPVFDPKKGTFKPCSFKDIVVLLRSSKSWTPTFEQIFLDEGIPLYADSQSGYFDTLEINLIMALLRIVDNPLQDLPMLTILRSPLVGLTMEEILEIKCAIPERTYYYFKCVRAAEILDVENPLKVKLNRFLDILHTLRYKATYMPLDAFVWLTVQLSDFYYYVSAMPGGQSRQANLKLLIDRATSLKGSRIVTLGQFIEFVDNMSSNSGDYGVANVISEEDNVVRLMSIHKSKGLEFPIVIISGLGRKFNFMDASGDMILHKKLGIGLVNVDLALRSKSKTLPQFAIKEQIKIETLSEEMRVLYVGLTRPVDQLILFATVSDGAQREKVWARGISHLSLTSASGFIDWIMPTIGNDSGVVVNRLDVDQVMSRSLQTEQHEIVKSNKWLSLAEVNGESKHPLNDEIERRLSFERPQ
ncbi:MAG TPA: helicase-exonuclease AddAB subunit AddA, partial [Clostridiales bacterium UBA8960]|nr:helicase-exonuclease AddAB subunit AddA [Clostridiales bacterium UBA8960]